MNQQQTRTQARRLGNGPDAGFTGCIIRDIPMKDGYPGIATKSLCNFLVSAIRRGDAIAVPGQIAGNRSAYTPGSARNNRQSHHLFFLHQTRGQRQDV